MSKYLNRLVEINETIEQLHSACSKEPGFDDGELLSQVEALEKEAASIIAARSLLESPTNQEKEMDNPGIQQGLLMKYFVMKPSGIDAYAEASRRGMNKYADSIEDVDPLLADAIHRWVLDEDKKARE